jgi:hypothetical protein
MTGAVRQKRVPAAFLEQCRIPLPDLAEQRRIVGELERQGVISFHLARVAPATLNTSTLVQKLWNYCNVLRDDGMSYGDYVEQFTSLLFLKMADERSRPPPQVIAQEIVDDLEAALEQFRWMAADLAASE